MFVINGKKSFLISLEAKIIKQAKKISIHIFLVTYKRKIVTRFCDDNWYNKLIIKPYKSALDTVFSGNAGDDVFIIPDRYLLKVMATTGVSYISNRHSGIYIK